MFRRMRKILIGLLLLGAAGAGYYFVHNPTYRRGLVQTAEEVKEDLSPEKKYAWSGTAVVTDALEGDVLLVKTEQFPKVTVHLAGIDAPVLTPEHPAKAQPLAEESRQYLAQLARDKAVDMAIVGTDFQKRPLVLITLDGSLLNAKMVEAGLAEAFSDTSTNIPAKPKHAIANAEANARQHHLGIWGLTNYVRPSEYRIRSR
jgi:endonuclease YncB( thermonuclease family)